MGVEGFPWVGTNMHALGGGLDAAPPQSIRKTYPIAAQVANAPNQDEVRSLHFDCTACGHRWPSCLHHFVSHPAKEEGIGLGEVLDRVEMYIFVRGHDDCLGIPDTPTLFVRSLLGGEGVSRGRARCRCE